MSINHNSFKNKFAKEYHLALKLSWHESVDFCTIEEIMVGKLKKMRMESLKKWDWIYGMSFFLEIKFDILEIRG